MAFPPPQIFGGPSPKSPPEEEGYADHSCYYTVSLKRNYYSELLINIQKQQPQVYAQSVTPKLWATIGYCVPNPPFIASYDALYAMMLRRASMHQSCCHLSQVGQNYCRPESLTERWVVEVIETAFGIE